MPGSAGPLKPQEAFFRWMAIWTPIVKKFTSFAWEGEDREQMWPFLRRAIIVRQFEALQATELLILNGHGNFGVVFLRPAFEELVWIEYLSMHAEFANELIGRLVNLEIADNVRAQSEYVGSREMARGGFTPSIVKTILDGDKFLKEKTKEIGTKLGWNMSRLLLPSMEYLSKQVGREKDYRFLYRGTSRYVHFSTQESFRRVWDAKGKVTISSKNFNDFWQQFAFSWGARIFADLVIACIDDFGEHVDLMNANIAEISEVQRAFVGRIPIITVQELTPWK